ncbi:FAD-binding oxidoreductase [soil metagenome]
MRSAAAEDRPVRPSGGGTKLGWGRPPEDAGVALSTAALDRIVEHNAANMTAVLEAGVCLEKAQEAFADHGQMLALDPPLGHGDAATIGGVVATGDSGPLRHRYGAARDLLLGMTVALGDGTVARSGGRVIKNVAGYDLAKLFAGSFGTLGLILEVVVRLHPLPKERATVVGRSSDAAALQTAALELARRPLELESLDISWSGGEGAVMARMAGAAARAQAEDLGAIVSDMSLEAQIRGEDAPGWAEHRGLQRAQSGAVVRVSARLAELARVLGCASRLCADVVGRAGLGLSWLTLRGDADDLVRAIEELRADLRPRPCVVLDAPVEVRSKVDVWGDEAGPATALMRRVKARFDPSGVCNPGVFVGGI